MTAALGLLDRAYGRPAQGRVPEADYHHEREEAAVYRSCQGSRSRTRRRFAEPAVGLPRADAIRAADSLTCVDERGGVPSVRAISWAGGPMADIQLTALGGHERARKRCRRAQRRLRRGGNALAGDEAGFPGAAHVTYVIAATEPCCQLCLVPAEMHRL